MNTMQKQQQNGNDNDDNHNELDIAFIADESKQPVSQQLLSFSQDRSVSGISFLNTPNYTAFSVNNDAQLSCLQSWPQQSIQPFKVCPKRNASIRQQSYQQEEEAHEKYTKKRIGGGMRVVDIKRVVEGRGGRQGGQQSYNSYCLRRKKKEVSYNENSSQQQSERNELRFLVAEIKERPITRSFKKLETQKDQRD